MVELYEESVLTKSEFEMIAITDAVRAAVAKSSIKNGVVFVLTAHTTSGITVNENLKCLEIDIKEEFERLVPPDTEFAHSHFLPSYGTTGGNAVGHLSSMICGNHTIFLLKDGEIHCGKAQDVYFMEFDGPQERHYYIQIQGE